ncbi:GntR family transcriptional regulator/MocR family aminotransferase [Mycoplana dimorpha]|uniref:GntR family transcriptional regulator/MocR family aminotransferase n=1 Tax=Mycoplana dimorpha TaxID=28320 RepID=A0A2T5AM19_MYCDI|nr:GntR family transcriptional regulator/MocR family aminotransferase [Mycoplana dimorpha]
MSAAYDQLISEGYIQVRQGAKPVVSPNSPPFRSVWTQREGNAAVRLSAYATRAISLPGTISAEQKPLDYDFRYGDVAPSDFPKLAWKRALSASALAHRERLGYDHPAGSKALRKALHGYVWRARGIRCDENQIVVVSGSQQALDLCGRVLINPGVRVVLEEPCYQMARNVMLALGAQPVAVRCDRDGIDPSELPDPADVACAIITPSHQFPLGGVLSARRRQELMDWAATGGVYLIEDDYDGEYRYDVNPIPPLQLSQPDRVIYVGTASKILSPTLRIGYLVVPEPLVEAFVRCKQITDRHSATFEQEALAAMIESGAYETHVRRMRRVNAERRSTFLVEMQRVFGDSVEIVGTSAGLHVVVWFNGLSAADESRFAEQARTEGVGLYPIGPLYETRTDPRAGFIFGYASMSLNDIRNGVTRCGELLSA